MDPGDHVRGRIRSVDGLRGVPGLARCARSGCVTAMPREAVADGIAFTGRVISAAALIMICVFLSFMLGDERTLKEFGFGLAAAVFLDALVIRCMMLPAVLEMLGPGPGSCPAGSISTCPNQHRGLSGGRRRRAPERPRARRLDERVGLRRFRFRSERERWREGANNSQVRANVPPRTSSAHCEWVSRRRCTPLTPHCRRERAGAPPTRRSRPRYSGCASDRPDSSAGANQPNRVVLLWCGVDHLADPFAHDPDPHVDLVVDDPHLRPTAGDDRRCDADPDLLAQLARECRPGLTHPARRGRRADPRRTATNAAQASAGTGARVRPRPRPQPRSGPEACAAPWGLSRGTRRPAQARTPRPRRRRRVLRLGRRVLRLVARRQRPGICCGFGRRRARPRALRPQRLTRPPARPPRPDRRSGCSSPGLPARRGRSG